jgi:hypothetical protein
MRDRRARGEQRPLGRGHPSYNWPTVGAAAYAMNQLYRADPEREWPSVSTAAYWSDQ